MKRILLIALFPFSVSSYSQVPNWAWAKSAGHTSNDYGGSISSDANGNCYVTGSFQLPTITFGSTTLTNAGLDDIYLVKYDNLGNVLWARSAGRVKSDGGSGVHVDESGNCYVTGAFNSDSITFGAITLANANPSGTWPDAFIVKYDSSGNVLWANRWGGTSVEVGNSVSTDSSGNCYITGIDYTSQYRIFTRKYSSSGVLLWNQIAFPSSNSNLISSSIYTDRNGNSYVAGHFPGDSITFGSISAPGYSAPSWPSGFVVKYNTLGTPLWAKSFGAFLTIVQTFGVTADTSNNCFITGNFSGSTVNFGSFTLTGSGGYDMFVAMYDWAGNVVWVRSAMGSSADYGKSITSDPNGNTYVTGYFTSPSLFLGSNTLTNSSTSEDIFVAQYDIFGNVVWAQSAGATQDERANCISIDATGASYITGNFTSPSVNFFSNTLTNAFSGGTNDVFVAKLDSSILTGTTVISNQTGIWFYPSPFSTSATLQIESGIKYEDARFELFNVLGVKVKDQAINSQSTIINRNNLPSGIYFYRVVSTTQTLGAGKVVVE